MAYDPQIAMIQLLTAAEEWKSKERLGMRDNGRFLDRVSQIMDGFQQKSLEELKWEIEAFAAFLASIGIAPVNSDAAVEQAIHKLMGTAA